MCVYGVAVDGRRWFVKTSTTPSATRSLRRAAHLHKRARHPMILALRHVIAVGSELALVYPWFDGRVLYHATVPRTDNRRHPQSAMARSPQLPVRDVETLVAQILDTQIAVEEAGFVAVDFYDGCVLCDFTTGTAALCDLDEYRPGPFTARARLPESHRFMAPEEHGGGALIDGRTNVFRRILLAPTGRYPGLPFHRCLM